MFVSTDDVAALQKELTDDYIKNNGLSTFAGNLALRCGRLLVVSNAVLITTKHVDFNAGKEPSEEPRKEPGEEHGKEIGEELDKNLVLVLSRIFSKLLYILMETKPAATQPEQTSSVNNHITSDVPATKPPIKHPGRVAAGKKVAEHNRQVREAKKKRKPNQPPPQTPRRLLLLAPPLPKLASAPASTFLGLAV